MTNDAEEIGDVDAGETEARLERANTALLWGEPASDSARPSGPE